MQEREFEDHSSKPIGICHRLFNFIINSLASNSTKIPKTLQPGADQGDVKVPPVNEPVNEVNTNVATSFFKEDRELLSMQFYRNDIDDDNNNNDDRKSYKSDIEIHFKKSDQDHSHDNHHNRLDQWTPIDKHSSSANKNDHDHDHTTSAREKVKKKNKIIDHHDDQKREEIIKSEPKRTVTIHPDHENDHENIKMRNKKGKNVKISEINNNLPLAIEYDHNQFLPTDTPRHIRPLLYAESSINEKSYAFIRAKKEAMRRNISIRNKIS